jgi:murein DD-endopeptidase MepM/ murein hydrolase activator NlpD
MRLARALALAVGLACALARGGLARPGADDDAPPQVTGLALPFAGIWGVVQGFASGTHTGYATYALDFVPAVRGGARLPPRGAALSRFPCFGRPVLSPADGTVVRVAARARDWPAGTKGRDEGNYVILEHAPREYTELRHLRAGSVRVTLGQRVRRGEVLGACGNSGNAGTPHVHLGFLSSVAPITTRPVAFDRYEVRGADGAWRPPAGPLRTGDIVRPLTW